MWFIVYNDFGDQYSISSSLGHGEQGKCGHQICLTFQHESFASKRKREVMNKKQNGLAVWLM